MPAPQINPQRTQLLEQAFSLCLRYKSLADTSPQKSQVSQRLEQIWNQLTDFTHPLQQEPLAVEQIPLRVRQSFVQAVSFVSRYSSLGGKNLQGTLASPTLESYRCDRVPISWQEPQFVFQLCETFALSPNHATQINTALAQIDQAISQQKIVIAALVDLVNGLNTQVQAAKLFSLLFNLNAFPTTTLNVLATPLQLVFALDYQQNCLRDEKLWWSLTEEERQTIGEFLATINSFTFEQFKRFPSFGYVEAHLINSQLVEQLMQTTNCSKAELWQILNRSVSIVPTHKSEAFLIHDIWGHFWQLFLTKFESDYSIMTTAPMALRPGLAAYTEEGPITLRELFQLVDREVTLDAPKTKLFFHGEIQQRLGHLFSHLVGEMLADMNEFKWLWQNQQRHDALPSSSLFKSLPTKLDLSLIDIDFLFMRVLQPLLTYELSISQDSILEQELLMEWHASNSAVSLSLKQAIAQMHHIFLNEYATHYQPNLKLANGIFGHLLANLLYLQNILNQLYILPLETTLPYQDLILLFVGCYCSEDCYQDFWDLDDVLAQYFLPCWLTLSQLEPS